MSNSLMNVAVGFLTATALCAGVSIWYDNTSEQGPGTAQCQLHEDEEAFGQEGYGLEETFVDCDDGVRYFSVIDGVPVGADIIRRGATQSFLGRPDHERYHSITPRNGGFIGELGASRFLLDEDGTPLSPGFHELVLGEDGNYTASVGACDYKIGPGGSLVEDSFRCTPYGERPIGPQMSIRPQRDE